MIKRFLASVAFALSVALLPGMAQETDRMLATVFGNVYDGTFGEQSSVRLLTGTAMLVTGMSEKADTLYRTITDGRFRFDNIQPRRILLKIYRVGMETISGEYDLEPGRNAFIFTLFPEPELLEAAVVKSDAPLIRHRGDTTVYNVKAITAMEGDELSRVLEQLPGFEVNASGIKVDGEPIKRAYVNGVLIFGDNALVAVGTLRADDVEEVRVFAEQDSEDAHRGLKHSRKSKVLDISTKNPILSLSDLLAYVAGGVDNTGQPRYTTAGAASYYSEMLQMNGAVIADNASRNLGLLMNMNPANILQGTGALNQTLSDYEARIVADLNFAKYWKSRAYGNSLTGEYKMIHGNAHSDKKRFEKHYNPEGALFYSLGDSIAKFSSRTSHEVVLTNNILDSRLKSIYWQLNGRFTKDYQQVFRRQEKRFAESFLFGENRNDNHQAEYRVHSSLGWRNNDLKSFRPAIKLGVGLEQNRNPWSQTDTLPGTWNYQYLLSEGYSRTVTADAECIAEWVVVNSESRTFSLSGGASAYYTCSSDRRRSLDYSGTEAVENRANSYDYLWQSMNTGVGLSLLYNTRFFSANAKLDLRNHVVSDTELYPDTREHNRSFWSLQSDLRLKYKGFRMDVDSRSHEPTTEQLRPRISDANPMVLEAGNHRLEAPYTVNARMEWAHTWRQTSLMLVSSNTLSFRDIVSRHRFFTEDTVLDDLGAYFAKAGSSLYSYENADEIRYQSTISAGLTQLLLHRKLSASLKVNGGLTGLPMFNGDQSVYLTGKSSSLVPSLTYTPSKTLKLILKGDVGYDLSVFRGGDILSERVTTSTSSSVNWKITPALKTIVRYSWMHYSFLQGIGQDLSRHILGVSAFWTFDKGKWELGIEGNDLLNSGTLYQYQITPEAFIQTWSPTYGRYFILSVKYRMQKKK